MHRTKELVIILFLVVCVAYFPSLFGGFVWDDEDFVYANQYVKEFRIERFFTENAIAGRGKLSNYYRPIQFSLYAIIYKLVGLSPFAYHLTGILIHGAASIVVFLFLVKLTKSNWQAFFISLLFGIHPVQTESVSYISGLSDQLYTFFFFSSLLFYQYREKRAYMLPLSILFFCISLLSKELALIYPGILFALMLYEKGLHVKKEVVPVFIVSAVATLYLILRLTYFQFVNPVVLWNGNSYGLSFITRLATFFHNFFLFIQILLVPLNLHMERDYTVPVITTVGSPWTLAFVLLNIVVIALLSRSKHTMCKQALFFWTAFLLSLIPYTGIFLLNGIFYEHYLYLPMIFFWGFVISILRRFLQQKMLVYILACILVCFVIRSYLRQWEWIDSERFYRQTLRFAPKSIRIINGLGMALAEKGDCKQAIQVYNKGLSLSPKTVNLLHNIANCFLELGNPIEAERYYKKAIATDQRFSFSYYSLLDLYLQTNQKENAKQLINETMRKRFPDDETLSHMLDLLK